MRSLSKFFSRKDTGSSHANKKDAKGTGEKRTKASDEKSNQSILRRASDSSTSSASEPHAVKGPVYAPRAPARLKERNPGSKFEAASPSGKKISPPTSTEPLPSRMGYFDHDATVFIDPPSRKKAAPPTSTEPLPSRMGHFDPDDTVFLN